MLIPFCSNCWLALLHAERPKLYGVLAVLIAIRLTSVPLWCLFCTCFIMISEIIKKDTKTEIAITLC